MIGGGYDTIWRGDSKLASAALKLARHVRTKGRRGGISAELLGLLLELVEFAQGACESPCLRVARMHDLSDPKLENPEMCAESLVMLARNVDAHPWGAFGFVHPKLYLSFLQQLTSPMYKVAICNGANRRKALVLVFARYFIPQCDGCIESCCISVKRYSSIKFAIRQIAFLAHLHKCIVYNNDNIPINQLNLIELQLLK